jgi:hypothetical protein
VSCFSVANVFFSLWANQLNHVSSPEWQPAAAFPGRHQNSKPTLAGKLLAPGLVLTAKESSDPSLVLNPCLTPTGYTCTEGVKILVHNVQIMIADQ